MPNTYVQGTTIRVKVQFTDANGALADPTTITLKVEDPAGAETTYTDAVKDSTGKYHRDIPASTVGTWTYRWQGDTGQVDEDAFIIVRSAFL